MASTKDVNDIFGLTGGPVKKPANKKKKKVIEAQPRLSGISREVQALMGDSVPPVQIVEQPKYKSKPSLASKLYKPRHWEEKDFSPRARSDGLMLRHWKRALPLQRPLPNDGDTEMVEGETEKPKHQFEEEFPIDKWDVSIRVPEFTDEQYEKHFKTDEWTREETDYLIRLASDYDLRWMLIADRYDPQEIESLAGEPNGTEVAKTHSPRTMEQLKLRYYQVAAQDLELRTPKSNMTQSEFQLWEKMRNFDAKTEGLRKTMAEKLFERTKDEAEEERTLLEELNRITKNEEDFINMRRDLYSRLEAAPSLRRNERGEEQNIVLSSTGLSELLNRLFAKEKHLKRRVIPNGDASSATTALPADGRNRPSQNQRRDTLETPVENTKKGSVSTAPVPKQLSKEQEERYGVSHPPEKLTSGVSFRHEKINRVTTAKSQVQTQKINAALTELEIPARLSMPTEKVCKEFERLVGQIQLLLDARKTHARVSEEVKTLEETRRQRLGEPASTLHTANGSSVNVDAKDSSMEKHSQANVIPKDEPAETSDRAANTRGADISDGGPGPAINEDDDDAEGEDDVENSNIEQTQVEDEDEQDETNVNDDSVLQRRDVDEDDEEAEDANEDGDVDADEEEEQEDDDDDDEGMKALRRGADNDDEDADEDDEEEEHEPLVEEGDDDDEEEDEEEDQVAGAEIADAASDEDEEDGDNEGEDDETQDNTMNGIEPAANGTGGDDDEDVEESRPTSVGSRGHKRGASVVSDASGDGSNRSAAGRKRKR